MNCPKCEARMEKVNFADVEVDRCTDCKGLWFDKLEQEKLKKIKGSEAIDIGDPRIGKEYDKIREIKCPACTEPMIERADLHQPHIHFESCPTCYGVFFDAGEFRDFKEETFLESLLHMFNRRK